MSRKSNLGGRAYLLAARSLADEMTARPRDTLDTFKGKVPQDMFEKFHRARCAHFNSLEAFPVFAAAVVRCLCHGAGGGPRVPINGREADG